MFSPCTSDGDGEGDGEGPSGESWRGSSSNRTGTRVSTIDLSHTSNMSVKQACLFPSDVYHD